MLRERSARAGCRGASSPVLAGPGVSRVPAPITQVVGSCSRYEQTCVSFSNRSNSNSNYRGRRAFGLGMGSAVGEAQGGCGHSS